MVPSKAPSQSHVALLYDRLQQSGGIAEPLRWWLMCGYQAPKSLCRAENPTMRKGAGGFQISVRINRLDSAANPCGFSSFPTVSTR